MKQVLAKALYWIIIKARLRIILLAVFAARYARIRHTIPEIATNDQALTPWKFFWLVLRRFKLVAYRITPGQPTWLLGIDRRQPVLPQRRLLGEAPRQAAWLFLADVLKLEGFFDDAEFLYRELAKRPPAAGVALLGLADLLCVLAGWADEYRTYERVGVAFNMLPEWPRHRDYKSWHHRRLAEAMEAAQAALTLDPDDSDACWMVAYCAAEAGDAEQADLALRRYELLRTPTSEVDMMHARALFAQFPQASYTLMRASLNMDDEAWEVHRCRLVNDDALTPAPPTVGHRIPAQDLALRSKIVRYGAIVDRRSHVVFPAGQVSIVDHAKILPGGWAVIAHDQVLLSDSFHLPPVHLSTFTQVRAVNESEAFIWMKQAKRGPVDEAVFIGANWNYFHFLLEDLPRLSLLDRIEAPVLIPDKAPTWQLDLFAAFGVPADHLRSVDLKQATSFSSLTIPSRLSRDLAVHPEAVRAIRQKLAPDADRSKPVPGRRLYVSRKGTSGRAMINEAQVVERFRRAGFQTVDPSRMSIRQQIDLFGEAEIIAGPAGAGLANIIFAPRDVKLLCLGSCHAFCDTFTSIASSLGQQSWLVSGTGYAQAHPKWIWTVYDYEMDPDDVSFALRQMI